MNRLYYFLIALAIFAVLALVGIMIARYYKRREIYFKIGQKSATPLEEIHIFEIHIYVYLIIFSCFYSSILFNCSLCFVYL